MQRKEYNKRGDAELLTELTAATGRGPLDFDVYAGDKIIVKWPDDIPESVIDAVVAAHSAQGYSDQRATREARLAQDLLVLRNRYANTTVPWEKSLLRVVRRLYGEVVDD